MSTVNLREIAKEVKQWCRENHHLTMECRECPHEDCVHKARELFLQYGVENSIANAEEVQAYIEDWK